MRRDAAGVATNNEDQAHDLRTSHAQRLVHLPVSRKPFDQQLSCANHKLRSVITTVRGGVVRCARFFTGAMTSGRWRTFRTSSKPAAIVLDGASSGKLGEADWQQKPARCPFELIIPAKTSSAAKGACTFTFLPAQRSIMTR